MQQVAPGQAGGYIPATISLEITIFQYQNLKNGIPRLEKIATVYGFGFMFVSEENEAVRWNKEVVSNCEGFQLFSPM